MRNFRELRVWVEAKELAIEIYELVRSFPGDEKYGLVSQMKRCSISIGSNIAEGSSRRTSVNFAHFLDIALGSSFELETQLILSYELDFVEIEKFDHISERINKLQRGINALRSKVLTYK